MSTERMQIVGIEISEGVSKKTGRNYSMGTVHTITKLAPPMGSADNVAKGYAGDKLECDVTVLRKIEHLPFPLQVEAEMETVLRFGERRTVVTDLRPLDVVKKAA